MKPQRARDLDVIAAQAGATSWRLVRESRHMVIDFLIDGRAVRRILPATPSKTSGTRNAVAELRKALRL